MFICKDVVENILDYVDRELDDKTLEELEKHQGDCPECKAFVMTYKKMLQLIGTINKRSFVTPEVRKRLKDCLRACLNQGKI